MYCALTFLFSVAVIWLRLRSGTALKGFKPIPGTLLLFWSLALILSGSCVEPLMLRACKHNNNVCEMVVGDKDKHKETHKVLSTKSTLNLSRPKVWRVGTEPGTHNQASQHTTTHAPKYTCTARDNQREWERARERERERERVLVTKRSWFRRLFNLTLCCGEVFCRWIDVFL